MISATIITFNEEKTILKVLKNLEGFVNEVIIVDSGSTDRTVYIAKQAKAKVYYRKFDNFANQKNFALSKANEEWILSIDVDEEIPDSLKNEINSSLLLAKNNRFDGYLISRRNFILGKEIKYSRWSPDKHIWLFRKASAIWVGEVHEEIKVQGEIGEMLNPKIHYSHQTIGEFFKANNFYSTLLAKSLFEKKTKFSFQNMFRYSIFEFAVRYFYKLGFLDGWRGFVLAFLMAIYQIIVWVKIWELEQDT